MWCALPGWGTASLNLLDFFLGEQPDSLQLLELRDPVLNPLLDNFSHRVHADVTCSRFTCYSAVLITIVITALLSNVTFTWTYTTWGDEADSSLHTCVPRLWFAALPVPSANKCRGETWSKVMRVCQFTLSICEDQTRLKKPSLPCVCGHWGDQRCKLSLLFIDSRVVLPETYTPLLINV